MIYVIPFNDIEVGDIVLINELVCVIKEIGTDDIVYIETPGGEKIQASRANHIVLIKRGQKISSWAGYRF